MIFVENHSLYALMKGTEGVYPRMPRVMKEEYPASLMMIQETGGLQAGEVFCDTSLNMTNSHTAAFLLTHGARESAFLWKAAYRTVVQSNGAFRNDMRWMHPSFIRYTAELS